MKKTQSIILLLLMISTLSLVAWSETKKEYQVLSKTWTWENSEDGTGSNLFYLFMPDHDPDVTKDPLPTKEQAPVCSWKIHNTGEALLKAKVEDSATLVPVPVGKEAGPFKAKWITIEYYGESSKLQLSRATITATRSDVAKIKQKIK